MIALFRKLYLWFYPGRDVDAWRAAALSWQDKALRLEVENYRLRIQLGMEIRPFLSD